MELEASALYVHEEHGDVAVLSVHRVYGTYDSETSDGRVEDTIVRFTDSWDDYGPMPTGVLTEPVEEFVRAVGDQQGIVEFETPFDKQG